MSIDCLRPLIKFWRIYRLGLKTKCFLASVDFSHQHRKNSANERNSTLFESFTASVAYFRTGKYIHFFTIDAPLEYYFFSYKVFSILYGGEKKKDDFSSPTNVHSQNSFFNRITVDMPTFSILGIFINKS